MGRITDKHNTEAKALLSLVDLLADCGIKESRERYFIEPEEENLVATMPPLDAILPAIEGLLNSISEGAYERIDGPYFMELQYIKNQLVDFHTGHYFEAMLKRNEELGIAWHRPRGVPKIETIGRRVRDEIIHLLVKMEKSKPGNAEVIRGLME